MAAGRALTAGLLALLLLFATGCAGRGAQETGLPGEETAEQAAVPGIDYEVVFEGEGEALPDRLQSLLAEVSKSRQLTERPPSSELILRRRAEADLPNLAQAMRSLGYYDGTIDFAIRAVRPQPPAQGPAALLAPIERLTTGAATQLVFEVRPGPQYRLSRVEIVVEGEAPGYRAPTIEELGLALGEPAASQPILDAEQTLLRLARKEGRPLARLGERRAVVEHPTRSMEVTFAIAPGPVAPFGRITFAGDEGVREAFLLRRLPFKTGDPFDPDLLEKGRNDLSQTNLFSTVLIHTPDALDAEGRLPVTYEVRVRAQRSVGAGIGYQTDLGPNAHAFWEHRNLFHEGERLRVDATASPVRQELVTSFAKPDFLIRDLRLLAEADLRHEDTDAYESRSAQTGVGVEYPLTEHLLGSLGIAYRYVEITDDQGRQIFGLVSFPGQLNWDLSNNLLDPSTGWRLSLAGTPFFDTLGAGTRFFRSRITHTRYFPLLAEHRLVLALRGSLGSIVGASREEIPADERLYSGGGGSVRGVGFQLAGPLDSHDNPLGGRSLAEFSTEFRTRFSETIGAVAFLDGGTVYTATVPDFSEPLRLGAGVGLRYITAIGPIRFDIGVPLNRRDGVDDAYQFYISIGQAF
jgi:translocation and assembly module TamA